MSANGAATTAPCSNSKPRSTASSINGVDIITFADDGRITHFKVMVRPLKAINLLHRLMGEQLPQQPPADAASYVAKLIAIVLHLACGTG